MQVEDDGRDAGSDCKEQGAQLGARGGKRVGAGRKKGCTRILLVCTIKLTPQHIKLAKSYGGGNVSAGLRWLLDVSKPLIKRCKEQVDEG